MNSSSTNLAYVDAAGWIALVNRRDTLHTEAVRIYKQLLQEQCQFITASVVQDSTVILASTLSSSPGLDDDSGVVRQLLRFCPDHHLSGT